MGPLDALMHLGNLFLPALALAALTAALVDWHAAEATVPRP